MDINNINKPNLAQQLNTQADVNTAKTEANKAQQMSQVGKPATAETVTLTDAGKHLSKAESRNPALPVFDSQRIEALKKAIEEGSYTVDADRVAKKLLEFDRLLG